MNDEASEASLADRLALGDAEALAALFEKHRSRLRRMVEFRIDRRVRQRVGPDDILQEAFLAATKRLAHYAADPFESPFVWLRMIVHQTLIDQHRRHCGAQARDVGRERPLRGGRFTQTTSASLTITLTAGLTSPSAATMRAESVDEAARAIEGMDPLDREVLALRHFEELSNAEVAEELDITPKAASIRYVRALRRLKDLMGSSTDGAKEADHE